MVRVTWSPDALAQLAYTVEYIQAFDPAAAGKLTARLLALGNSLHNFPNRGKPARNGTRELSGVWPYILRYSVEADGNVLIVSVRHGARGEEA